MFNVAKTLNLIIVTYSFHKLLQIFWETYCFKGTVTRFCTCAAFWFLPSGETLSSWLIREESSSIDPERPENAIILVMKNYLVHFESFEPHILYFHVSIVEKGEVTKSYSHVVVSVPTNGSNVVIWLSFLSIKLLQLMICLCWMVF